MDSRHRIIATAILAVMISALMPGRAAAAPPPRTATAEAMTSGPVGVVFVPYEKMKGPEWGLNQSVMVPYAEFLRLRESAAGKPEAPEFRPTASLARSLYKGTISGDVVIFDAEFVIEVRARAKDQLEVRLPFRGAAIERAEVEGPQLWLGPLEEGSGLRLLLRGEGARTVKLRLVTNLNERGAVKGVDFSAPRAGASSLSLRVGEEVEMESVQDSLPATVGKLEGGGYEIRASGGSAEHFVVMFKPKVEVTGAAAETRLSVSENVDLSVSAQSASARIGMRVELLAGSAKA
ncbi:MAG: hypothetical protein V2A74_03935, partial [bacterium]